jgi:hypothetical protein
MYPIYTLKKWVINMYVAYKNVKKKKKNDKY